MRRKCTDLISDTGLMIFLEVSAGKLGVSRARARKGIEARRPQRGRGEKKNAFHLSSSQLLMSSIGTIFVREGRREEGGRGVGILLVC